MAYDCNKCKKKYSSQQSLCNHNKRFHSVNDKTDNIDISNKNKCNNCNKIFVNRYTLKYHLLNNCYIKKYNEQQKQEQKQEQPNIKQNTDLINLKLIKKETELIKLEQIKEEKERANKEIEILKLKLQLKSTTTSTTTNNNVNNINNLLNNSNNTTNNVFNIVSVGRENIKDILSELEKRSILNSRYNCLEEIVKIIHGESMSNLGVIYFSRKNYKESIKYFELGSTYDDAIVQLNLGIMYYYGYGVEINRIKSFEYLQLAAKQDNAEAKRMLCKIQLCK